MELETATLDGFTVNAQEYAFADVDQIREHPENPHVGDVRTIRESISVNGFYGALIVQKSSGFILAGNHRFRTAVAAGARKLPTLFLDVDDDTARRILAVDNRAAPLGAEDEKLLLNLLGVIPDLAGTGYDLEDLQKLSAEELPKEKREVFEQSVQVTPNREFVLILADTTEEWERVRTVLGLGTVRRGGYKPDSVFDATGPARVAKAKDFLKLFPSVDSNPK